MSEVNDDDFGSGVPQDADLPHLHVLCHERNYIMNRLPELSLTEVTETTIADNSEMLSEAKQKIVAVLALIFGGDKVTAEYCLVNLISRVYHTEGTLHIGNVPLNITGLENNHSSILVQFLKEILPLFSVFESTTDSLSETMWQPKKNYDTNRLNESVLGEMPTLSNLLIDETLMNEGKIEKNGVDNIKAIATLIEE